MAKTNNLMDAFEKYKSTGNNEFFTLADDGDTAIVRFLYSSFEELDWFVVHETEIGGKKRWVECTEEPDCPLCAQSGRPQLKLFLQLVQKGKEDTVMTWERGQRFIPQIQELFQNHSDLTQQIFEIERKGKKGDANTKYIIHHIAESKVDMESLPERQVFLGEDGFILQKTHKQMREILAGNYQYHKVENPVPRGNTAAKKDVEVF